MENLEAVKPQLAVLAEIRKRNSKFDFMFRGHQIRFKIEGCDQGLVITYTAEIPIPEGQGGMLAFALGGVDPNKKVIEKIVEMRHVHLKWWERLLRISIERKGYRVARKSHAHWMMIQKYDEMAKRIAEKIG